MTTDTKLNVRPIKTLMELGRGLHYMRSHETAAESAVAYSQRFGHLPDVVLVYDRWNYMPVTSAEAALMVRE